MASESTRAGVTLLLVIAIAVAGAWAWTVQDAPVPATEAEPTALYARVLFEEQETRMDTPTYDIPPDGVVEFPAMPMDLRNVTSVGVSIHVQITGFSGSPADEIRLDVTNPAGDARQYTLAGSIPPNLSGNDASQDAIRDWKHAPKPKDAVYDTTDAKSAEAWAAENFTDTRAVGEWSARVEATLPELPVRSGNVSLTFSFLHYTGTAVLEDPSPAEPRETAQDGPRTGEAPANERDVAKPRPANRAAASEDVSRTFFTWTGLGRSVDRGPGPYGAL